MAKDTTLKFKTGINVIPSSNRINLTAFTSEEVLSQNIGLGRKKVTDERLVIKWTELRNSAHNRGFEFDVSLKRLRQILNTKRCAFTGVEIHFNPDQSEISVGTGIQAHFLSIERVDPNIGYIDTNICAMSATINKLKTNLAPIDIIRMARKLEKLGFGKTKRK